MNSLVILGIFMKIKMVIFIILKLVIMVHGGKKTRTAGASERAPREASKQISLGQAGVCVGSPLRR